MSGLSERVIEDWLIRADERGYQLAFVSALMGQGFSIRYVSSHTTGEHGKDVIAVSPDGQTVSYQLKVGGITTSAWRAIAGEVDELITVPIQVPSLPEKFTDRAFLVLTGRLADPVRDKIASINRARGGTPIEVLQLDELVEMFTSFFDDFIPHSVQGLDVMLRLYLRPGTGPADPASLCNALSDALAATAHRTTADRQRALSNTLVAALFASTPYRGAGNQISVITVWVVAACTILRTAKSWGSPPTLYVPFLEICKSAIYEAGAGLLSELTERDDFSEGNQTAEYFVHHIRRLVVLGHAGAIVNARAIDGDDVREAADLLLKRVERNQPYQAWSEASWNFILNLSLALGQSPQGNPLGEELVVQWLKAVAPYNLVPMDSPYQTIETLLSDLASRREKEPDTAPVSYTVRSAVHFLARRMRRQAVSTHWRTLTHFATARFVPAKDDDYLSWQSESGDFRLEEWEPEGSWRTLRENAFAARIGIFAGGTEWLLPFFLLAFPHRVDERLGGELDALASYSRRPA